MSLQFLHVQDSSENHTDAIWGAAWTSKDQVITVSADGSAKQYDVNSGQTMHSLPAHMLGLTSLSVSPSGSHALYNTLEGLTCLWDLTNGDISGKYESYVRSGAEQTEPAWSVSLHPSGKTYAATGGEGVVTIHSADPSSFGERKAKLETGRAKFGMFTSHSPDGTRVASSLETGQVYIFDLESGALASTYTTHAMAVRSLAWSADSQLLLSASDDKRLILYDVRVPSSGSGSASKAGSGAVASLIGHTSWVLSTAFSPDAKLILSGSADKSIKVWDVASRAAVSTIQDTGEVWSVSWRPQASTSSGGAFVTGGEDGVVKWWRSAGAG